MAENLTTIVQTVSIVGGVVAILVVMLRFSSNFVSAMTRIESELKHLCGRMVRMDDRNDTAHESINQNLGVVRTHVREHGLDLSALEAKVDVICKANGYKKVS